MTQSCHFICLVSITTVAGVGGIALFGTSRSGDNCFIAVTLGRNNFCLGITTDRAGIGDTAVNGAGCVNSDGFVLVTQSGYFVCLVAVAAE